MDYETAKVPMEVDFHREIDNRLAPSGIQKVQEDFLQGGHGYRGLEGTSRLMIDTTMIHIGREIDREARERQAKRHGLSRPGRYPSEGKDPGWDRGVPRCISHILRGSAISDRR